MRLKILRLYIVSLGDLHSVDRNVTDLEGYSSHSTTFFLNKCFFKMSLRLTMTLWFRDVVYHLKISFTQLLTNLVIIMLLHDPPSSSEPYVKYKCYYSIDLVCLYYEEF